VWNGREGEEAGNENERERRAEKMGKYDPRIVGRHRVHITIKGGLACRHRIKRG
jgi:hypothetical protein